MISSEKTTATNDIFICWYKTNFCISVSYFTCNRLLLPVYGMRKNPTLSGLQNLVTLIYLEHFLVEKPSI